jgi:hypothetical protein
MALGLVILILIDGLREQHARRQVSAMPAAVPHHPATRADHA